MLRCAITPGELALEPDLARRAVAEAKLIKRCRELAGDGVDFLLVREKEISAGELTSFVRRLLSAVDLTGVRVLVAQRVDVSEVAGAHGVHLSATPGELTPAQVRQVMPKAFVSVSCHTLDQVRGAVANGADAILFAPIFGKWSGAVQISDGVGVKALSRAVEAARRVSVFALGGVTSDNALSCEEAGAAGIAGIRFFFI